MDSTATLLFQYLKDVLYGSTPPELDLSQIDPEYENLGKGLIFLSQLVDEEKKFAGSLAKGDLNAPLPSRGNELAAPLKALQSSLKHLTWQSQVVARGNYDQRVDFMGDFSAAFNSMIEQLDARSKELMDNMEKLKKQSQSLSQMNVLLTSITAATSQMIIVASLEKHEVLYHNFAARDMVYDAFVEALFKNLPDANMAEGMNELPWEIGDQTFYYVVQYYPLEWMDQNSIAFLMTDISADKYRLQQLENVAYRDELTGLFNRFHGMNRLTEIRESRNPFTLCFIDLDNLKYINDQFGHKEGDFYIVTASRLLKSLSAIVARIGGDEFMAILPGITKEESEEKCSLLNDQLLKIVLDAEKPYTCSMSYGSVYCGANETMSVSEILSVADERMYTFKKSRKKARAIETAPH